MKHIHHDMIIDWAKDTSRVVQSYHGSGDWFDVKSPQWYPNDKYRFKPEEPIVVNGINVPEPVRGELEEDQSVWLADTSLAIPCRINWLNATSHSRWLRLGLIHLTREAAQAHIDAMLLPSRSDVCCSSRGQAQRRAAVI